MPATNKDSTAVTYTLPEVDEHLFKWTMVTDCIEGDEQTIKAKKKTYLPPPTDDPDESKDRYASYLQRAVFYNMTGRTHAGMVGQVFSVDPKMNIPAELEMLQQNADGEGTDLLQFSKRTYGYSLGLGRYAILTSYNDQDGKTASVKDVSEGRVRPRFTLYKPQDVINWRAEEIDGKKILTLVVLREKVSVKNGRFGTDKVDFYRVYEMPTETMKPVVSFWQDGADGVKQISPEKPILDYAGNPFPEIPVVIGGATSNSPDIDKIPFLDLAQLNMAHYRNSADYEDSVFIVGQPTLWVSGISAEWFKEVLKGKIRLGSRSGLPLGPTGQAGLLQPDPNTMAKEAMELKERAMVALGARLAEQRTVQRTLGEAELEEATETSIMISCAQNTGAALTRSLFWAMLFHYAPMPENTDEFEITLNTDFKIGKVSVQERAQIIAEWTQAAITWQEMRDGLRRAGSATMDDDEAKKLTDEETKVRMENAVAAMGPEKDPSTEEGSSDGKDPA